LKSLTSAYNALDDYLDSSNIDREGLKQKVDAVVSIKAEHDDRKASIQEVKEWMGVCKGLVKQIIQGCKENPAMVERLQLFNQGLKVASKTIPAFKAVNTLYTIYDMVGVVYPEEQKTFEGYIKKQIKDTFDLPSNTVNAISQHESAARQTLGTKDDATPSTNNKQW
jgi:hypothetical protein